MNHWLSQPDSTGFWWVILPDGRYTIADVKSLDGTINSVPGHGEVYLPGNTTPYAIAAFAAWHAIEVPAGPAPILAAPAPAVAHHTDAE